MKFRSVAPYERYTALTQLSLSRVYASRLETRDSQAARNWLVASYGNFPPNQYIPVVFFNATSVRKQNLRNKKHTSRASLMPMRDAVLRKAPILMSRPPMPPCIMHPAPPKAQGSILTWIKDTKCLVISAIRGFRPLKLICHVYLYTTK